MPSRYQLPFHHIDSTAPSFQSAGSVASSANALESTAIGRTWDGPASRAVRVAESSGIDYYLAFGSSTLVAVSSESMLVLGGTVEIFHPIVPSITHIAILSVSTSTAAEVNVTLGYGQ